MQANRSNPRRERKAGRSERPALKTRLKTIDRWQIILFAVVLIIVAVCGVFSLKDYSEAGRKSATLSKMLSEAEQYSKSAVEIDNIINHEGSSFDDYMEGKLRANGYGVQNEVWNINGDYGD